MADISLAFPAPDTAMLLRQWLAVYKARSSENVGWFSDKRDEAPSQIVQLTATILAHGSAYFGRRSVTTSLVRLARRLNGSNNRYALAPEFLEALNTGNPTLAWKYGVTSNPIILS